MGKTLIVPGSQFHRVHEMEIGVYQNIVGMEQVSCNAGTVIVWHTNLWHSGRRNDSEKERYMFKYGGSYYIQHNPLAPEGWEGFKGFINYFLTQNPNLKAKIVRVIAEGDFVVAHSHFTLSEQDQHGLAAMDIFRLENGKIVEHWDVLQPVPEKSANANGMF